MIKSLAKGLIVTGILASTLNLYAMEGPQELQEIPTSTPGKMYRTSSGDIILVGVTGIKFCLSVKTGITKCDDDIVLPPLRPPFQSALPEKTTLFQAKSDLKAECLRRGRGHEYCLENKCRKWEMPHLEALRQEEYDRFFRDLNLEKVKKLVRASKIKRQQAPQGQQKNQ